MVNETRGHGTSSSKVFGRTLDWKPCPLFLSKVLFSRMNQNLMDKGIEIFFCHRTFQWSNEARGVAGVHCIILGFSCSTVNSKAIYDYETPKGEPTKTVVKHINPYLVDADDIFIFSRTKPLQDSTPLISYGSMPIDNGCLILSEEERNEILIEDAKNAVFIREYTGGNEFINNAKRYCLWLKDFPPQQYRNSRLIMERIAATRKFRESSNRSATRNLALTPMLFGEIRQPETGYLLIPKVSSENRPYMPIGFIAPAVIANGSALIVPSAGKYHFGVLASTMHMAWMRHVCGRMKSDYQYSNSIVYNNFPWPENVKFAKVAAIEKAVQAVLGARAKFPDSTLADLYDPNTMPPALSKAHAQLDKAVDAAYGCKSGVSELERMALLFGIYKKLIEQK